MTMLTIFIDIDDVLADSRWRQHLIASEGWDAFHARCSEDNINVPAVHLLDALRTMNAFDLAGLSGRNEKWHAATTEWCTVNGITLSAILLRPDDDRRPAPVMKIDLARQHIANNAGQWPQSVLMMIDDRDDVLAAFRAEGIATLQFAMP